MKKKLQYGLLIILMIAGFSFYYKNDSVQNRPNLTTEKKENKAMRKQGFQKWRNSMLVNVETNKIEKNDYYDIVEELKTNQFVTNKTNIESINWVSQGPDSQGGRTRTLLFDKDDENLLFTGSVSGGLFKSTDAGNSWNRIPSFFLNNPAIMSLAQSLNGTIFVGTGESFGSIPDGDPFNPHSSGSGIYKSNNLGQSWTSIDETNEYSYPTNLGNWSSVSYLAAHPTNTNVLFAGTKGGLKISTNAEDAQPVFSQANGIPVNKTVSDIKILENGIEGWCAIDGEIYKSTGDLTTSSWSIIPTSVLPVSAKRAQIAVSKLDASGNYTIYASFSNNTNGGCLIGVYKSEDKGNSWSQIIYAGGLDPFKSPTSTGCQGSYDHCIAVSPNDKDKLYIGGVIFFTWSSSTGGLKRADKIATEGGNHLDPKYIHADKHGIFFSPHDATGNTMYIVGDGGVFKTNNAFSGFPDEMNYSEHNRNYITLQGYSVGTGKYGEVITGSQDNGTQYNDYKGISPKSAKLVTGGDGVAGAEISNLSPNVLFSGWYFGNIKRSIDNGVTASSFLSPTIDVGACGFITCTQTTNLISCDDLKETGQNFVYPFLLMETHNRLNPRYDAVIEARNESIQLPGGGIAYVKDTIKAGNVINHPQFSINKIPEFDGEGLGISFDLQQDLYPGEKDSFENKFDAKYFIPTLCGDFFVCTNPLETTASPIFSSINIPLQSNIKNMDYSNDGDLIAAVAGSNLIVMQGWDAYDPITNPNSVSYEIIPIGVHKLSGVSVDKNDKNRIMVTQFGYGGGNKMFMVTNATHLSTDAIVPVVSPIQGDLPRMPVYSCVISIEDNQTYIIGTELGIFATRDGGVTWEAENTGLGARMPVYGVRQEWMNNFNCSVLSASALGGGMYTSSSLSSCDLKFGNPTGIEKIVSVQKDIKLYPNPASDEINISFESATEENYKIMIVDPTGKMAFTKEYKNQSSTLQTQQISISNIAKGSYFIAVKSKSSNFKSKIFIKK